MQYIGAGAFHRGPGRPRGGQRSHRQGDRRRETGRREATAGHQQGSAQPEHHDHQRCRQGAEPQRCRGDSEASLVGPPALGVEIDQRHRHAAFHEVDQGHQGDRQRYAGRGQHRTQAPADDAGVTGGSRSTSQSVQHRPAEHRQSGCRPDRPVGVTESDDQATDRGTHHEGRHLGGDQEVGQPRCSVSSKPWHGRHRSGIGGRAGCHCADGQADRESSPVQHHRGSAGRQQDSPDGR